MRSLNQGSHNSTWAPYRELGRFFGPQSDLGPTQSLHATILCPRTRIERAANGEIGAASLAPKGLLPNPIRKDITDWIRGRVATPHPRHRVETVPQGFSQCV